MSYMYPRIIITKIRIFQIFDDKIVVKFYRDFEELY